MDDGSGDRTADLAETFAGPRVRLLRHPARRGIGAVLRTALAACAHPLVACTEFGSPYAVGALDRMLEVIDHVDLVSGYRGGEPAHVPGRLYHWLARSVFGVQAGPRDFFAQLGRRLPARVLFALRLTDVACGFRLYRRTLFDRIPIQSDGPFAQVEILAKANFLGCMMTEVPVHYRPLGPVAEPAATLRQALAEARSVFFEPDFGPAPSRTLASRSSGPPG